MAEREQTAKDAEELRLEKLIFGDDAGFLDALREDIEDEGGDSSDASNESIELGSKRFNDANDSIEDIPDADLFFTDFGDPAAPRKSSAVKQDDARLADEADSDAPAWVDSDDERIVVSLASNTRLRKLRRAKEEDLIDGKEYVKRLQQQFEMLYPRPSWAKAADTRKHRKKQRRTSVSGSSEDEEDSDAMSIDLDDISSQPLSNLLQSTAPLTKNPYDEASPFRQLRPDHIDVQRSRDVGESQPSSILSLSFHPEHPILLTSGFSGLATLFHLSPTSQPPNPVLHTLHIRNFPIHTSAFHSSGKSVYLSSRRRYFMIWSLDTGKVRRVTHINTPSSAMAPSGSNGRKKNSDQRSTERFKLSPCGRHMALIGTAQKGGGVVNILDSQTCQWICQARVEGRHGIADIAWWGNGEGLLIVAKGGDVIEYCMRTRSVLARWHDQGAVNLTVVALGGSLPSSSRTKQQQTRPLGPERWVALGSQSGIVNIYDRSSWTTSGGQVNVPEHPEPKKTFEQLVTSITHLLFTDDGQMLVMVSGVKKRALRLIHLPSCNVYAKWPNSSTAIGRITAIAFSKGGKMLAMGDDNGRVRMFEIRG